MWVLTWRPCPTRATKLQDPEGGFYCKISIKALVFFWKTSGPIFGFFRAWFFFFNLDCSFWFMSVPVDGCYIDSFQQPPNWIHKFCFQYLLWPTAICSWNLKVSVFKPANGHYYQGNWKMDTTQTSCIKIWMLKCFKLFYLINLVTTFKWSKTHSIVVMATC